MQFSLKSSLFLSYKIKKQLEKDTQSRLSFLKYCDLNQSAQFDGESGEGKDESWFPSLVGEGPSCV